MFNIRNVPPTTEIDVRKIYNVNNVVIDGVFQKNQAWVLFEVPGKKKFAISLVTLLDNEFSIYEDSIKANKVPSIPKALFESMRSYAELNLMMRGH